MNYRKVVHWTLLGLTILYLITGLSVTYFNIAEAITFGLLSKSLASRVHELLIYLFVPILALHLYFKLKKR